MDLKIKTSHLFYFVWNMPFFQHILFESGQSIDHFITNANRLSLFFHHSKSKNRKRVVSINILYLHLTFAQLIKNVLCTAILYQKPIIRQNMTFVSLMMSFGAFFVLSTKLIKYLYSVHFWRPKNHVNHNFSMNRI